MARDVVRVLPLFFPVADAGAPGRLATGHRRLPHAPTAGWSNSTSPACRPQDMELSLAGSTLTVRGVRRDCCVEEGCRQYRMEIAYSRFERRSNSPAT